MASEFAHNKRYTVSEEVLAWIEIPEAERGVTVYLTQHHRHRNHICFMMGSSDESHYNVKFIMRGKVTKCAKTTRFEEKAYPKRGIEPTSSTYQLDTLPLGQTGSRRN